MSDPLSKCPEAAKSKSPTLDVLSVIVPYKGESSVEVSVPPVLDPGQRPVSSVFGTQRLTLYSGGVPTEKLDLVGWDTDAEQSMADELRDRAEAIYRAADKEELHPDANEPVGEIAWGVLKELDRVRQIYDKWSSSMIKAKRSESPFSFYQQYGGKGPLDLGQSRNSIGAWAAEVQNSADALSYFNTFSSLLGDEKGGWQIGDPTPKQFWDAMLGARQRDRERIRDLYRRIFKGIYCAEYGVAQSESYFGNKAIYEEGRPKDGRQFATPDGGGAEPPPRLWKVARFTPPDDVPPPDDDEEPPGVDQALPPDTLPGDNGYSPAGVPWYQTPGGRALLIGGGVVAAGGAAYGLFRLLRRPSAPTPAF